MAAPRNIVCEHLTRMRTSEAPSGHPGSPTPRQKVCFAANAVRLTPRDWLVATVLIGAALWLVPASWQAVEPLNRGADHRLPYRLGNDYWHYNRTCRAACRDNVTLLVGDSVLWGHYVDCRGTLSHYLNELSSGKRFENLGIDGIHPVALAGLKPRSRPMSSSMRATIQGS